MLAVPPQVSPRRRAYQKDPWEEQMRHVAACRSMRAAVQLLGMLVSTMRRAVGARDVGQLGSAIADACEHVALGLHYVRWSAASVTSAQWRAPIAYATANVADLVHICATCVDVIYT